MANGGVNYRCYARQVEGKSSCVGTTTERSRADEAAAVLWINHVLWLSPSSPVIAAIARDWLSYNDPDHEARKAHVGAALESAVGREMQLDKERFVLGRMTEATYDYLRGELANQISALKTELAELSQGADLSPLMDPEALTDLWYGAGIGGQRALLRATLGKRGISLAPARHRGDRTPILDRLEVDWRDKDTSQSDAAFDAWEARRNPR